jgi:hypothetical protein
MSSSADPRFSSRSSARVDICQEQIVCRQTSRVKPVDPSQEGLCTRRRTLVGRPCVGLSIRRAMALPPATLISATPCLANITWLSWSHAQGSLHSRGQDPAFSPRGTRREGRRSDHRSGGHARRAPDSPATEPPDASLRSDARACTGDRGFLRDTAQDRAQTLGVGRASAPRYARTALVA